MPAAASVQQLFTQLAHAARRRAAGWWGIVVLAAQLLDMGLRPSTYRAENGRNLAQHIVHDTTPMLAWFTVLTTLISLIVIRIVLVTALSYGLTRYALEMVVRVLVLELIPLTAALFAALRCTLPNAAEVAALRGQALWQADTHADTAASRDALRREVLPRVASGLFCALLLAAMSCAVTLVVAYLSVYGLTTSGLAAYTRTVGHVFNPAVALILGLKVVFLGVAVALVPMAAVLDGERHGRRGPSAEVAGLVRMFLVILLIEAVSLIGNYY